MGPWFVGTFETENVPDAVEVAVRPRHVSCAFSRSSSAVLRTRPVTNVSGSVMTLISTGVATPMLPNRSSAKAPMVNEPAPSGAVRSKAKGESTSVPTRAPLAVKETPLTALSSVTSANTATTVPSITDAPLVGETIEMLGGNVSLRTTRSARAACETFPETSVATASKLIVVTPTGTVTGNSNGSRPRCNTSSSL